jgi:hypothetical protein
VFEVWICSVLYNVNILKVHYNLNKFSSCKQYHCVLLMLGIQYDARIVYSYSHLYYYYYYYYYYYRNQLRIKLPTVSLVWPGITQCSYWLIVSGIRFLGMSLKVSYYRSGPTCFGTPAVACSLVPRVQGLNRETDVSTLSVLVHITFT